MCQVQKKQSITHISVLEILKCQFNQSFKFNLCIFQKEIIYLSDLFSAVVLLVVARLPLNLYVPEIPVAFAGYLLELQEDANFMVAVQSVFSMIGLKKVLLRVKIAK